MSDKKPEDEFDWTQALADWAQTTFAPEPAERRRSGAPSRVPRAPSVPEIDPALLPDLGPPPVRRDPTAAAKAAAMRPKPKRDDGDEPATKTLYRSSSSLRAAQPVAPEEPEPTTTTEREPVDAIAPPPPSQQTSVMATPEPAPAEPPRAAVAAAAPEPAKADPPASARTAQWDMMANVTDVAAPSSLPNSAVHAVAPPTEVASATDLDDGPTYASTASQPGLSALAEAAAPAPPPAPSPDRSPAPSPEPSAPPPDEIDALLAVAEPPAVAPPAAEKPVAVDAAAGADSEPFVLDEPRIVEEPVPESGPVLAPETSREPPSAPSPSNKSPSVESMPVHARPSKVPGTSTLGALLGAEPSDAELDALLDGFPDDTAKAEVPAARPAAPAKPAAPPPAPRLATPTPKPAPAGLFEPAATPPPRASKAPTPPPRPTPSKAPAPPAKAPAAPVQRAKADTPPPPPVELPAAARGGDEEEPTAVRALPTAELNAMFNAAQVAAEKARAAELALEEEATERAAPPPAASPAPPPATSDSVTAIRAAAVNLEDDVTRNRLPSVEPVAPKPPVAPSDASPESITALRTPMPGAVAPAAKAPERGVPTAAGPFSVLPAPAPSAPPPTATADADVVTSLPDDRARRPMSSAEIVSSSDLLAPAAGARPDVEAVWTEEMPAARWLGTQAAEALAARAAWLEDEARRVDDKSARARGLLAVSELVALVGESTRALALAREARDAVPQLALAHRQVRGLMGTSDGAAFLEQLDASLRHTTPITAKMHDALVAAEVLRVAGDDDGSRKRYEQAARIGAQDGRLVLSRAAMALARGETNSVALRIPDADGLVAFARASASALRLRGIESRGAPVEGGANEPVRAARAALAKGDVAKAATALAPLTTDSGIGGGARWLEAALAMLAPGGAKRALERIEPLPGVEARRFAVARALEADDGAAVLRLVDGSGDAFSPPEVLAGAGADEIRMTTSVVAGTANVAALAAAAAGVRAPLDGHVAGDEASRRAVHLGRLLAASSSAHAVSAAVSAVAQDDDATMRALVLDTARDAGRFAPIVASLGDWGGDAPAPETALAAAFVAERGGDTTSARDAFRRLADTDPTSLLAIRALASLDPEHDEVKRLRARAEALAGTPAGAVASLELFARLGATDDGVVVLEDASQKTPDVMLLSHVLERATRRRGELDRVVAAIRAREGKTSDPLEVALDGVREALLVADTEPERAGHLLETAHRARPDDVALRELYERLTPVSPEDRAAWCEKRAAAANDDGHRALWLFEAARSYGLAADGASLLRVARQLGGTNPSGLAALVLEDAELRAGQVERLTEVLMTAAKAGADAVERREAYERLAAVDLARGDRSGAHLWHRSILEETPDHLPSLRLLEHALLSDGREDELEPIAVALAERLATDLGGEGVAHAALASWLRARAGDHGGALELADVARKHEAPPLWALRAWISRARAAGDHQAEYDAATQLAARAQRPADVATLHGHRGDAALRLGRPELARTAYETAVAVEPGDVSLWEKLARVRKDMGDRVAAAEALESVARTSNVPSHRLAAWYEAAVLWTDLKNDERARPSLEQAAKLDLAHADVFARLTALYVRIGAKNDLADVLERRARDAADDNERLELEVQRGRLLAEVGEPKRARQALEAALAIHADHAGALDALSQLSIDAGDYTAAESALVRLTRLLSDAEEQRAVYAKLGALYADHLNNMSRAELAFREVLRRAPDDVATLQRLVGIYAKQNDAVRALEVQQELVLKAKTPEEKRERLIELSKVHETVARDLRKAEQALEGARKEQPHDVGLLRALAEFYTRHRQLPAVHILLDRTAGDVRRALGAGRFSPQAFAIMTAVYELRGQKDAAALVGASLRAIEGEAVSLPGAEAKAGDPRLDDTLAPELISGALRALLARAGDALDALAPVDLRAVKAAPLAGNHPVAALVAALSRGMGLSGVQIYTSPQLGMMCVPVSANPPAIVLGEALARSENGAARAFLVVRAVKLLASKAGALVRIPPKDSAVALGAFFRMFNPSWEPPGLPLPAVNEAVKRLHAAAPKGLEADLGLLALEAAGNVFAQPQGVGPALLSWGNRVALLAVGDPNAALDAMAWSAGLSGGAPTGEARVSWLTRTAEARDVLVFSLSDAYAEARKRVGLGA